MGEAKRRQKLTAQVLSNYQFCIYCGGHTTATTVDHVPPRAVFDLRQRPRGLEFPACKACNDGGRLDELVASMLSRVFPDPDTETAQQEAARLIHGVNNNCPGLLEEMMPSARQRKLFRQHQNDLPAGAGGALNCEGPRLNRAIHRFGAKIGYALRFELMRKSVPHSGAACVWWLTNFQALKDEMPHQLFAMMGEPRTLRQGRWEVADQFRYASIGTQEGTMSAHFATFRFSFAICAFVAEEGKRIRPPSDISHVTFHAPGWLWRPASDLDQMK